MESTKKRNGSIFSLDIETRRDRKICRMENILNLSIEDSEPVGHKAKRGTEYRTDRFQSRHTLKWMPNRDWQSAQIKRGES